ncbi:MAG: hypothetical protein NWE89_06130 [Candidatus Bathyarchaeota archaeon]|nr:hypothetical protein [Candidatus Bathyarchaeota archaeon]
MERFYHKSFGDYSYEIMNQVAYERFWWGKRPSSKKAFEAWLSDPDKTQYQIIKEHGRRNLRTNMFSLVKDGIIRRFQRNADDKSIYSKLGTQGPF